MAAPSSESETEDSKYRTATKNPARGEQEQDEFDSNTQGSNQGVTQHSIGGGSSRLLRTASTGFVSLPRSQPLLIADREKPIASHHQGSDPAKFEG
jgi:hypothetical protein